MAYTRGMKRRGAPLPRWGRKRPRFSARRRGFRSRRTTQFNSQRGVASTLGFKSRRIPYRRYKNILYNSSNISSHYRSYKTTFVTFNTSTSVSPPILAVEGMQLSTFSMVTNSFWTTAGGSSLILSPAGYVFIRGGLCTLRVHNGSSACLEYKLWHIRTKSGANPTSGLGSLVDLGWDPTIPDDFHDRYKIVRSWRFQIEGGDRSSFSVRLPSQRVDITDYNNQFWRDFWVIGANAPQATALTTYCQVTHNLSFTADVQ